MPRRATTNISASRAISRLAYRRNSSVAQVFMVLSFVSAGLLFSVQLIYPEPIASNHSEAEMALVPAPSSPPDLARQSSRTPLSTSASLVSEGSSPWTDSPQDETVMPSAKEMNPFLTGFSAIQYFVVRGPGLGEPTVEKQEPKREPAQLVPPSSQVIDNSLDSNQFSSSYIEQQAQRQSQSNQAKPLLATFFAQVFGAQVPESQADDNQLGTPLIQPDEPQTAATTPTSVQPQSAVPEPITMHLVVDLSDRQLTLYKQDIPHGPDTVIDTYPIAIGKAGWETPIGEFVITDKDPNPIWRHPLTSELVSAGENSPLGTRWIGFWTDGVYQIGFHGTNQAQAIGQAISHGCIRLQNSDIESLYTKVEVGTSVLVQP